MTRKTYAVNDLMEWHLTLPTGYPALPYLTVKFEGGHVTGYGVSPARYTTTDPYVQKFIEQSEWFKRKRIYLLKSEPLKGGHV